MNNLTQLPITPALRSNLPLSEQGQPRSQANAPHDEQRKLATDERRAAALADVQQMAADFAAALEQLAQTKADLHREEDRCAMLTEERNRYRAEALVFRSKLIQLATVQSNIGLLTLEAQDVIKTVHELTTRADTPSTEAIEKMAKDLGPLT